jgi:putative transposase
MERELYAFIKSRVMSSPDHLFHAIGGTEDHVHLVVSVKPTVEIDRWIGQIKGASSHHIGRSLQWQSGYGVVSFGTRDLPWVVDYVRDQKEHHRKKQIFERLEKIEAGG